MVSAVLYDEAVRYYAIKQAEMTSGRASMLELDTLIRSWAQAQSARVELQRNQSVVRGHALTFNSALIALRRILRAVVGTSHLDYQMLRASRTSAAETDDDDSVVEEEPGEAPMPEAPGTGDPVRQTEAA